MLVQYMFSMNTEYLLNFFIYTHLIFDYNLGGELGQGELMTTLEGFVV